MRFRIAPLIIVLIAFSSCIGGKQRFIEEAKGVALCRCVTAVSEQTDTDYSQSYFIEYSTLSPDEIYKINIFVDSNIAEYMSIPSAIGGNMNGLTCWKLFESDELDRFVRFLYRNRN